MRPGARARLRDGGDVIDLHAQQLARQILDDHVITTIRVGGRRQKVCTLCQRPAECPARQRAADLLAGRRDVAGRPL